ncbi:MAG: tetratricopeptide repeat protein [Rhodanobacteraceae bacterium]|nr:MAG: tetratricopeptide repeat protein [Rhodanobacteraceae bacterium]
MTTRFLIIAAVMVVVALGCMVVPMLRSARREGRPRMPFVLALLLVLATPPAVFGLYLLIGTPQALVAAPAPTAANLADAARQLQASLAKKPGDAKGWALLAQAYSALNEPQQALDALDRLLELQPDNPDALVAWVEASVETSSSHLIGDASRSKLRHALTINPHHQRALWLLGISDFQRKQYADAARQWKTLLPLLQPGSKVAATVKAELAEAERASGAAPAAASTPPVALASTDGVALHVTVTLAPKLADQLKPGDALFVFARAVNGSPMPLAVAKLHPSRIPVQVTLTNAMAMAPGVDLAAYPRVEVAARISRSGNAMPQAGDLESAPVEVATDSRAPIALTIDKVD